MSEIITSALTAVNIIRNVQVKGHLDVLNLLLSHDSWMFFSCGHQMCLQKRGRRLPGSPEDTLALLALLGQSLDPPRTPLNNVRRESH